jgi:predicted permease
VLAVVQVALALVLLIGAGLMIRTFHVLSSVHPGFVRPDEVQTFRLFIPESQVKERAAVARMHQAIMDKIAAVPGVSSVALASTVTMNGDGWHDPLFARDHTYSESQIPPIRLFKFVSPGYMRAMGASLVAGRDFTWDDLHQLRPVAMVSENLARELWGQPAAAIGRFVRPYTQGAWRQVVGVVSDMREDGLDKKATTAAYWPLLMEEFIPGDDTDRAFVTRSLSYVVRSTRTGSEGFVSELGRAVWSINSQLPIAGVRRLQEIYDRSLARTSFALVMLVIAGAMALLLGITGIYGVISYSVSQRTREIGIRVALGAQARSVRRMFVAHGLVLGGAGVAIGIAVAVGMMRLMSTMLFDVSPGDPLTYGLVSVALIAAATLASYIPAARATAVEPMHVLRAE